MFKIGEFSKLVRVSPRMLRYYEQNNILYPEKIDILTGYRLYSASQIPLVSKITALRDMGFNVDDIKEILPNYHNVEYMKEILNQKELEINETIHNEQTKLQKISIMNTILQKENDDMIYDVEIKKLDAVKVISLRKVIPAYNYEGMLWGELGKYIGENNIETATTGYSIYHDGEYKEGEVDVEIAIPVTTLGTDDETFKYKELEAIPQAATIRFSGQYENYNLASEKLAKWIEDNGYEFAGLLRGYTVNYSDNPDELLVELQAPIK